MHIIKIYNQICYRKILHRNVVKKNIKHFYWKDIASFFLDQFYFFSVKQCHGVNVYEIVHKKQNNGKKNMNEMIAGPRRAK